MMEPSLPPPRATELTIDIKVKRMFTYTTNRALSLLLLLLTSTSVWSVEFPVPDFFDLSIVSEDMSYSGVALSVAQFSSSKGVSDIERYYEAEWPDTRVSKLAVFKDQA